jgi:hypothetical protein
VGSAIVTFVILAPQIVAHRILNVKALIVGMVIVVVIGVAVWHSKKEISLSNTQDTKRFETSLT